MENTKSQSFKDSFLRIWKMNHISPASVSELNELLRNNLYWANGKNIKLDHLHATGAKSRWEYENIWGIYLTNPESAWMGLWMSVTDRTKIPKRNISYVCPQNDLDDFIGQVRIFIPEGDDIRTAFCESESYLYLVDPHHYDHYPTIDLMEIPLERKVDSLVEQGFYQKEVERKGEKQTNLFYSGGSTIVKVDSWQIALVNIPRMIPDIEVSISSEIIWELYLTRVSRASGESLEEYVSE